MKALLRLSGMLLVVGGFGCEKAPSSDWPAGAGGETVPAGDEADVPGAPVASRFWAEIHPVEGRMELYRLYPGNIIYRGEHILDLNYNYGGSGTLGTCQPGATCVPPADSVRLFTDQTKITYVDRTNGFCHQNGQTTCAFTWGTPCDVPGTFCAPIQMVSNYAFGGTVGALPDVIVQLANPVGGANTATGCQDNPSNAFGLCATTGAGKVDAPTSNLTSPIPGNGGTTRGCSYCYGNLSKAAAAALPGLQNTVLSGFDSGMANINTDTLAIVLTNDNTFGVTITVRYAVPAFNPPGNQITGGGMCATPGTTNVNLNGGGFGPPAPCFGSRPLASCPTSGAAATGYQVLFPAAGGGTVAGTVNTWSDTRIAVQVPVGAVSGHVTVSTPIAPGGVVTTSDNLNVCPSGMNIWRTLMGTSLLSNAIQPGAGATTTTIVIAGGRTSAGDVTGTESSATQLLAIPSVMTPNPTFTAGPSMITSRYGAAYTVDSGGNLWMIGGEHGGVCLGTTEFIAMPSGTWTAGPSLPGGDVVCQGVAVTVGSTIVVSGGSTTPFVDAGFDVATSNNKTYVLSGGTWSIAGVTDATDRFNQAGASIGSSAIIVGGSNFTPSPVGAVSRVNAGPTFQNRPGLGVNLSMPAAANLSGFYFVFGGSSSSSSGTAGATATFLRTSDNSVAQWNDPAATGTPSARAGHVLVSAGGKLYSIGGENGGVPVTTVDEYTP